MGYWNPSMAQSMAQFNAQTERIRILRERMKGPDPTPEQLEAECKLLCFVSETEET